MTLSRSRLAGLRVKGSMDALTGLSRGPLTSGSYVHAIVLSSRYLGGSHGSIDCRSDATVRWSLQKSRLARPRLLL